MDDKMEPYLVNTLPLIDILVLDEADRMVADGHFKEMHKILEFIYSKRVEIKKNNLKSKAEKRDNKVLDRISSGKSIPLTDSKVLSSKKDIDLSKIVDLDGDDERNEEWMDNLIVEENTDKTLKIKSSEQQKIDDE